MKRIVSILLAFIVVTCSVQMADAQELNQASDENNKKVTTVTETETQQDLNTSDEKTITENEKDKTLDPVEEEQLQTPSPEKSVESQEKVEENLSKGIDDDKTVPEETVPSTDESDTFAAPLPEEEWSETEEPLVFETADLYDGNGYIHYAVDESELYGASSWRNTLKTRLENAFEAGSTEVNIKDLGLYIDHDFEDIMNVYNQALGKRYFYVQSQCAYYYYPSTGLIDYLKIKYLSEFTNGLNLDYNKIETARTAYNTRFNEALATIDGSMSEAEKILAVHDFIVRENDYDLTGNLPDVAYTPYGLLVLGKSVCEGYSRTLSLVLQDIGIESYLVTSDRMNHMWNVVKVGGYWYHVDATWDDPISNNGKTFSGDTNNDDWDEGFVSHKYFLLSDNKMSEDHYGWSASSPRATNTNYDNLKLHSLNNAVYYKNSYWYYAPINSSNKIYRMKFDGSQLTNFITQNAPIKYLHALGSKIYFNTANKIISVGFDGKNEKVLYDYSKQNKTITEFTVRNGNIVYYLKSGSNIQKVTAENILVTEFVNRLYESILGRTAQTTEVDYHVSRLVNRSKSGSETAAGFIFSPEFMHKKVSDSVYLDTLYRAFMDRKADSSGKNYYLNMLTNGVSREYVFHCFVASPEFGQICDSYKINSGSYLLTEARDQNPNLTMFIYRLYDKALGRKAEASGLNYHANEILSGRITPIATAQNFIFSPEFQNKKLNNTEYVKVLYRTFMGREYDQAGLNYHLNRMNNGVKREDILLGFAYSPEFKAIAAGFGL